MFITAEIGINANADRFIAYEMMDEAQEAGVDAVKFQTWGKGYNPNLEQYRFFYNDFEKIFSYAKNIGLTCFSTPFDFKSMDFLDSIGMDIWKIPSGKVTEEGYLKDLIKFKPKKIILSTGMEWLDEVKNAVAILKVDCDDITILQCTSLYPAPYKHMNLKAMDILGEIGYPVGLSDHSLGVEIPYAACALGAVMLEKHFTLDCNQPGLDHRMSIEPEMLKMMVNGIRNIEEAMGSDFDSSIKNIYKAPKDCR